MARFNENDPVRSFDPMLSMGPHRYVLGYGNPLSYVDPDGKIALLADAASMVASWRESLSSRTTELDDGVLGNVVSGGVGVANALLLAGEMGVRGTNAVANISVLASASVASNAGFDGSYADSMAAELAETNAAMDNVANVLVNHKQAMFSAAVLETKRAFDGENRSIAKVSEAISSLALAGGSTNLSSRGRAIEALARDMQAQVAKGITVVESAAAPTAHGAPLAKICGTGSCFVAGTPVMTIEGLKAIETIQVGELVAARNEFTGNSAWQRVETVFITYDREVWNLSFLGGDGKIEVITATPNHPFALATGGWREASELMPGEQIATLDGREVRLLTAQILPGSATTYNLKVALDSTYFVGNAGLWVHNQGACCPGAKIDSAYVEGGRHRDTKIDGKLNGTESHHLIADAISPITINDALAIRMKVSDHMLTESHGSSVQAKAFRKAQADFIESGNLTQALKMGVEDIELKFGASYYQHLVQMFDSAPKTPDGAIDWSLFKLKEVK